MLFAICPFFISLNWPEKKTVGRKCGLKQRKLIFNVFKQIKLIFNILFTVSRKRAKIKTVSCKSHQLIDTLTLLLTRQLIFQINLSPFSRSFTGIQPLKSNIFVDIVAYMQIGYAW